MLVTLSCVSSTLSLFFKAVVIIVVYRNSSVSLTDFDETCNDTESARHADYFQSFRSITPLQSNAD